MRNALRIDHGQGIGELAIKRDYLPAYMFLRFRGPVDYKDVSDLLVTIFSISSGIDPYIITRTPGRDFH